MAVWALEGLPWRPLPDGALARRAEVMAAFAKLRRDGLPLLNAGVVGMGSALREQLRSVDLYAMLHAICPDKFWNAAPF